MQVHFKDSLRSVTEPMSDPWKNRTLLCLVRSARRGSGRKWAFCRFECSFGWKP